MTIAVHRFSVDSMTHAADAAALTAEDLFLISSGDETQELNRGVLVRTPPAGALHGRLAARIGRLLDEYAEVNGLGIVCGADTGFILARNPDVVRAPDVSFIARDRVPVRGAPESFWPFAPDLAVEVVSTWDRVDDLDEKILQYFSAGTRLVWVLHPRHRSVHVYRSSSDVRTLGIDDELTGDEVLPGFRCPVRRCFD